MKPTTINVQITKNPKQYEAVRIGLEATLDPSETVESAIKAATAQLNAIYAEMYGGAQKVVQNAEKPQTNANPTKERLTIGDNRVQQAVARSEGTPQKAEEIIANMHKYFELDADVEKALQLAAQLNNKLNK